MGERGLNLHMAKVLLTECSKRRHSAVNRLWYWRMFAYAQTCRRAACAMRAEPTQGDLFGGLPA